MLEIWVPFFLSAAVIVVAGIKLSYYGDIIAEKSGMGRTVVGLLLISFATSLPELVTSIKAARLGSQDLVIGNMVGSNLFNLSLLFLMDFLIRKGSAYSYLNERTVRTASGSMLLMIVLGAGFIILPLAAARGFAAVLSIPSLSLHIGLDTLLLALVYAYIVKKVVISGSRQDETTSEEPQYATSTLKRGIIGFIITAGFIIGAGLVLTSAADRIAALKVGGVPLGGTFVGSLFLAVVTSLPEMVATIGSVRLKAYDMALGNIFGSNLFNLSILFIADLFFTRGGLTSVSVGGKNAISSHLISILAVLAITTLALTASRRRTAEKRFPVPVSWVILFLFLGTQVLLFLIR